MRDRRSLLGTVSQVSKLSGQSQSPLGILVPLGSLYPGGLTLVPPTVWSSAPSPTPQGTL